MSTSQANDLYAGIRSGDRAALSRAITLVESTRTDHIDEANTLLDLCMQEQRTAMRIAISGAPGVGKSTMIEALGTHVVDMKKQLAVLAVDPSSRISGGSVLGDKTRMQQLAQHPHVYVRPSPSGTVYGGVADRTREAVLLCEAAGFDVVMIETVGTGQSETQVRTMSDLLVLLLAPGGGDEVQGIKRGILELADLVVINKADGDQVKRARETQAQYTHALRLLRGAEDMPDVLTASAVEGTGIAGIWKWLYTGFADLQATGRLAQIRSEQDLAWFDERYTRSLLERIRHHPAIDAAIAECRQKIGEQEMSVRSALAAIDATADRLLRE